MEDIPQGNPMHEYDPTAPAPPQPGVPGHGGGRHNPTKPGKLQAISIIMLISGIINCLFGVMLIFGCYTAILTPLLLTAGILEIVHASKLLKDPIEIYKPATGLAILEICCILGCNWLSLVAGILHLVFSSDPEVKQYYRDIAIANGYQPQV